MSNSTLPMHGNSIYPWELWTNGRIHKAKAGRQFSVSADHFRKALLAHARRHKLKAETRVKGDVVTFRFVKVEQPKRRRQKAAK